MNALTKVLTTGLLAATAGATAQTEHVIEQGANYSEDVFFSLEAGVVATQPTGNWDLAFDVSSPFSNAVRINDGNGRALAVVPGVDISGWADVDTAGYSTWPTLYNGLDTWVNGAFNVGTSDDPSDFGWGTYSGPPLHQVIGDSIYVFTLEDGTAYKLRIDLLNMGVWTFTYAALDGAGPVKRFWTIVFPLLSPTTFFLLVVNIVYAFFDTFGVIDATTGGGPASSTQILVYKVFVDGVKSADLGGSSAQSAILMLIVIALTVVQFRFVERKVNY